MKIGFVTQWFEPETGSAAHPTAVAKALAERGHEVKVLTGFPNYPHGKVYPGYQQRWQQAETISGMNVRRVPAFLSHDASAVRRASSLMSFGASASAHRDHVADCDVNLVYASPMTAAAPAVALRRTRGIPFALYVQDLWPDTVTESGFIGNPRLAEKVERRLHQACSAVYRRASRIAVISPGMKEILVRRDVPEHKIDVVYNWVDEESLSPAPADPTLKAELHDGASFVLMYAGGVGHLQSLDTAVQAIALLGPQSGVRLAIVGDGVARSSLEEMVRELGVSDQVRFLPPRSLDAMPSTLAAADAHLVSLRNLPLFSATMPSKIQANMACAQPMLIAAPGDAASIGEASGAALTALPDSPQSLAAGIAKIRDLGADTWFEMGRAGRRFYDREFSRSVGASRLESVLESACRK